MHGIDRVTILLLSLTRAHYFQMPTKRLQGGRFWIYAQIQKKQCGFQGSFEDYVPKAEDKWEPLEFEDKLRWKQLMNGFKTTETFSKMRIVYRRLRSDPDPEQIHDLKRMWGRLLVDLYSYYQMFY